ncbi:hypothetical protein ACIGNX_06440 [Actinosynnema sp. NPDC053489]|uniref:hypothetical protein n=1 Tax=Actinosynnema sp. NPDC053489 TaxID=3363916 RepID=UPI0037C79865
MSDDIESFSNAAGLGGLRTRVIDKFVATQAAINVIGVPSDAYEIKALRKEFQNFPGFAKEYADRELRQRVKKSSESDKHSGTLNEPTLHRSIKGAA